jgi:hypothetical protein
MLYEVWDLDIQPSVIQGDFSLGNPPTFWTKSSVSKILTYISPINQPLYSISVFFSFSLMTWAAQPLEYPDFHIQSPRRFYTLMIFLATYIQSFAPLFGICHAFLRLYYLKSSPSGLLDAYSMDRLDKDLLPSARHRSSAVPL